MQTNQGLISVIVPMYNEAPNLPLFYKELHAAIEQLPYNFEIVYVDDGSKDDSVAVVRAQRRHDRRIRLVRLARNFGKEVAMTAGLHVVRGDAAVIIDADMQMPPSLLGQFIEKWRGGAEVVVGVFARRNMSRVHMWGSHLFYRIMRLIAHTEITPHATDYRLVDRQVIDAFNRMTEHNRITRGLIDWLGFRRAYVHFEQRARSFGRPTYNFKKLVDLAITSFTSFSMLPLKLAGYLGVIILCFSAPLGLFLAIERFVFLDPLHWGVNGTTMLAMLTLFLVGVVLACLGLMALYIGHIYDEVTNRPLYITRGEPEAATAVVRTAAKEAARV